MRTNPVPPALERAGTHPQAPATSSLVVPNTKPRRPFRRGLRFWSVAVVLFAVVAGGVSIAYEMYQTTQLSRTVRQPLVDAANRRAREPLRKWLAIRPNSGEALYYKAWAAMASDQPEEAGQAIELARKMGFDRALLDCLGAIGQSRSGRFKDAEPILEQAFQKQLEPQAMIAKELARIYLASFRLEKAAVVIERWRSLAPEDPEPYLWNNEILARSDSKPAALILNFRAALERDPGLDKARLGLAEQLSQLRRFDEAEQEYLAYLQRHPNDLTAQVGLGRNAFQQGDIDVARRYFEAAVKANPRQADAIKELCQIDLRFGRIQQACESLKRLTQLDPFDQEAHYSYAQALRLAGDLERAQS